MTIIFLLFFNSVFYFAAKNTKFLAEQEHSWKTSHAFFCTLRYLFACVPSQFKILADLMALDPFPLRKLEEGFRICHLSARRYVIPLQLLQLTEASSCTASKSHKDHSHITSITTFNTSDMVENMINSAHSWVQSGEHINSSHSSECLSMPASSPQRPGLHNRLHNTPLELPVQSLNDKSYYIGRLSPKSNPLEVQTEFQCLL